ncbi:MAG TPA: glutamate--tRNA ligase [Thermoplasmata archaeon]|nr:glutamate--tRNA ligase [Thermoplasmata archaeon]
MALPPEVTRRARRLALANAVAHGGAPRAGPIVARLLATDATLRPRADAVRALVAEVVADIAQRPTAAIAEELAALGGAEPERAAPSTATTGEFPDLPDAVSGHVVLRLAPFPSGALHIGHARMMFVNQLYRDRYQGKMLLVFDDTVGSEEKRVEGEFYGLIEEDLALAGIRPDATHYRSDRIALYYPWARRVIEKGGAYVCTCAADLLRANRAAGVACPERAQSVGETLDRFARMLDGGYRPGEAVLRLRTDLHDPDPAFRDRVLFRLSDVEHPRVGRRFRVWPLLEFSWAVDDVELGITHVLRGKDLVIEDRMQQFVWDLLGLTGPKFLHWGILRVREAKVSKSKSYREVKNGTYDGWADPRTWSLRSLDRRGISMEALRAFTLSFGMSLSDIEVPAETLYAENRKRIDATTPRRSFVPDPVEVTVADFPAELAQVTLANHPDVPALGMRQVAGGPAFYLPRKDVAAHLGEEVRLKDLVNVRLPDRLPPDEVAVAAFTTRENRRLPRIQWVGTPGAVAVDVLGMEGEHTAGWGERTLAAAPPRAIYQFERFGFVRVDDGPGPGPGPLRVVFGHP